MSSSKKIIESKENIRGKYFCLEYNTLIDKETYYEWIFGNYFKNKFIRFSIYIFHENNKTLVFIDSGPKDMEYKYCKNKIRFLFNYQGSANEPVIYKYLYGNTLFMNEVKEMMEKDKDYYTTSLYDIKNNIYNFEEKECWICNRIFNHNIILEEVLCDECVVIKSRYKNKYDVKKTVKKITSQENEEVKEEKEIDCKTLLKRIIELETTVKIQNSQIIHLTQISNCYFNNLLYIPEKIPLNKTNLKLFVVNLGNAFEYMEKYVFYITKNKRHKYIGTNYMKCNIYFYGAIEDESELIPNIKKELQTYTDMDFKPVIKNTFSSSIEFEENKMKNLLYNIINEKFIPVNFVLSENYFRNNLVILNDKEYETFIKVL